MLTTKSVASSEQYPIVMASSMDRTGDKHQNSTRFLDRVSCSHSHRQDRGAPTLLCLLITIIGLGVGATILAIDIPAQAQAQESLFRKVADESFLRFHAALDDYHVSGLWLHQACHSRKMPFGRFREVYEYISSTGLEFLGLACGLNVSASERPFFENQSKSYLASRFPYYEYEGFTGVELNETTGSAQVIPMPNKSFYFVTHFVEPLEDPYNLAAVDFDLLSSQYHNIVVTQALQTGNLSMTERLRYLPPPDNPSDPYEYSLISVNPGLPIDSNRSFGEEHFRDAAVLVLRFNALLEKAYQGYTVDQETIVYVYDSTASVIANEGQPAFLGGAALHSDSITLVPEVNYTSLSDGKSSPRADMGVFFAGRQWSYVVVASPESYKPDYFLAIFGALMIVLASACAALYIYSRSRARAERAAILLESAETAARTERDLNDFIAHEVRNPLSAAISANEFVSLAVNAADPLPTVESRQSVREDVIVIGNSLQYINDLLRSMLDFHCAVSKQITIHTKPVSVRHDVFDPVASMLYHRGFDFSVLVDCPEELVVMSDPLRLKQIALNLAVNATKFVIKGFVRLRAEVKCSRVCLFVEDSGPGLPFDKRDQLFSKFQPSLDSLNQGTGIGLSLCKHLVELMGGDITLDDSYDSGIDGCPGCRFIVTLKGPPVYVESSRFLDELSASEGESSSQPGVPDTASRQLPVSSSDVGQTTANHSLPDNLSILFVDDDFILRKLFIRSIKRCRPDWVVCEAASGEAAMQLIDDRGPSNSFDVIFLDQYMASTQKQLLGTETVRLLRSKGIRSVICGLSANDIGRQFTEAGADAFSMKPLPCDSNVLIPELHRILGSRRDFTQDDV